ncbi:MAG: DUF427 domain-containing protein [Patescibacteria group bacterium]
MKAVWNGHIAADSNDTIVIEGNHYFPPESVNRDILVDSDLHTACFWKGEASYYNLKAIDEEATDAAWYYPEPKEGSVEKVGTDFTNYVAFYPNIVSIQGSHKP